MNAIARRPPHIPRAALADTIWLQKYRFNNEADISATFMRVANSLASHEADPALWAPRFFDAMSNFDFLPAGRILAGAGTGRDVTLSNCFVMGTIPDSLGDIYAHVREGALTMQQGGGIGVDFSTLRPRGAPVKGVGADASGPVSFMDAWDTMCRTVMSAGSRRGAMMGTLRCDHPDIEEFIDAKRETGRLRMFNLSVLITDAFMEAVRADASWPLVFADHTYRTVSAVTLWQKIMRSNYEYAEPGVIFIDRVARNNNLSYCETISATNPCGEEPLPPYGACLLGSINAVALVRDPFTPTAHLDMDRLAEIVPIAIRMMDNVIDTSRYALPEQRREAENKRRLGLGVLGLADALIMCGLTYGSPEAVETTRTWLSAITRHAYLASAQLAQEKGTFPLYDADQYLASPFIQSLDADVQQAIRTHGIRNSHLTSIAPNGTISNFANVVTGGIEPVFARSYTRDVLQPDGSKIGEPVYSYSYRLFCHLNDLDPADPTTAAQLPASFIDAQTLTPDAHIVMQAAAQHHVDASISKTVNVSVDIAFADFENIYLHAYELGCKGCTTYRPNPTTGAVLTVTPPVQPALASLPAAASHPKRPVKTVGSTTRLEWPASDQTVYLTANHVPGQTALYEVFLNTHTTANQELLSALAIMTSFALQHVPEPPRHILFDRLSRITGTDAAWHNGRRYDGLVPYIIAAIRDAEAELAGDALTITPAPIPQIAHPVQQPQAQAHSWTCPVCAGHSHRSEGGCHVCNDCGHSRCG
jgi:ribonucleoside-diphosphate reductase alpha chain